MFWNDVVLINWFIYFFYKIQKKNYVRYVVLKTVYKQFNWCIYFFCSFLSHSQQLDAYKTENLRLKEENGALIRVISKLSKWNSLKNS